VTDDVFERRTRRFVETLEILERLRTTPWDQFSTDPEKYGSAERFLQVAVEILDDLGAHLVARDAAGPVERYRDIPDRLLAAGRLREEQADVWRRVIGFRNVIVLDYMDVDRAIVYDILTNRLDELRELHRALVDAHVNP
jgi:uncharacterized protein YutE (UPF0331/DUF86 family)